MERFKKVTIGVDKTSLSKEEQSLVDELILACKQVQKIFQKQMYDKELDIASLSEKEKDLFSIYHCPYDFLKDGESFLSKVPFKKPLGSAFYPENITKGEIQVYLEEHPSEKEAILNPYTIISKKGEKLLAHKYHEAFKEEVEVLASHLKKASELTKDSTLKNFLEKRAQAVKTDDYFESEMLWMDLSGKFDVTIGPYEVYKDELFGVKTAYEAFVAEVDKEETKRLEKFESLTKELEKHLPLDDAHKNFGRGTHSPIKIVNEIYSAGDCNAGVHFTAFNLPNDEKVREAKGSKKVMIKNIAHAKYEYCWLPIVQEIFDEETQKRVSFDAYFTHVLLHEISHGIGPGNIIINNKETTVSQALKETYSVIEEAKADLLGLFNANIVAEKGIISRGLAEQVVYSFVAGIFRSIRFGIHEAHGGANIIALNRLYESNGVTLQNNKLHINPEKTKETLLQLLKDILVIEAEGNYVAAKDLIAKERKHTKTTKALLERLKEFPIDIHPIHRW